LHFCWYEIMRRIIVTLFWGYQYHLNYHSFSHKGYHFTYQRNTHTSLINKKKTPESQNSYKLQTRSRRAGRNIEMERYPQNLERIQTNLGRKG
jgi:hypothetical protein